MSLSHARTHAIVYAHTHRIQSRGVGRGGCDEAGGARNRQGRHTDAQGEREMGEVGRARREGHPRTKRAAEAEKTGTTEGGGKMMRRATVKRGQIPHEKKGAMEERDRETEQENPEATRRIAQIVRGQRESRARRRVDERRSRNKVSTVGGHEHIREQLAASPTSGTLGCYRSGC